MVDEAQKLVIGRLDRGSAQLRFPGFYGVMADANWVPDEGHASILKMTLQYRARLTSALLDLYNFAVCNE